MADTHTVMSKSLAKALMDAGVQHFDFGGLVSSAMGPLGGLIGGAKDLAASSSLQASAPAIERQAELMPQAKDLYSRQTQIYGQQQGLAQQLLAQSQGQGPSVAQNALAQSTGQNVAQQAALMAGQRGAGANAGMIARQAAMAGAGVQQQAAGQAATLRAQEILGAQNALAQQQAQIGSQNLQGMGINQQAIAAQNGAVTQGSLGAQQMNMGRDMANIQGQNQLTGAMLGAIGSVGGKAMGFAGGGYIPGEAEVNGDSPENDRVPALLSPGEVVLPRSVTQSANPVKAASDFMANLQMKKEHKGSYEVHNGKDSFHIAKKGLSNEMQAKLAGLPKFFDGGETDGTIEMPEPEQPESSGGYGVTGSWAEARPAQEFGSMSSQTPQASSPGLAGALGSMQKSANDLGTAQATQQDMMAEQYQKQEDELQAFNAKAQENQTAQATKINALQQDILNNKQDPNRLWNSKSTGEKIGASIAIILGGIGAGLQGPNAKNMALEVINSAIDKDIDAQKSEMNKKQTLLGEYFRESGDMKQAEAQTRMHMLAVNQARIAKTAAATNSPIMMERAKQAAAAIEVQKQQMLATVAQNQAKNELVNRAESGGNQDMTSVINTLAKVDPKKATELRARYVPGVGMASTPEGGKAVRDMQASVGAVKEAVGKLKEIVKTPYKSLSLEKRAEADTIRNSLVGALRVPITGPGAMNDGEREMLMKMIPDVTSFSTLDKQSLARLNSLESTMDSKYNRMLDANNIKAPKAQASNPMEGKTVRNAAGERLKMKNGKWVPLGR